MPDNKNVWEAHPVLRNPFWEIAPTPGRFIAEELLDELTDIRVKAMEENDDALCRGLAEVQLSLYSHVQEARLFHTRGICHASFKRLASPQLLQWMGFA